MKLLLFRPRYKKYFYSLVVFVIVFIVIAIRYTTHHEHRRYILIRAVQIQIDKLSNLTLDFKYTKESRQFSKYLTQEQPVLNDNGEDEAFIILNDTTILPPSARIRARKIFTTKPLVIWATEWHMTPIKDVVDLISSFGVTVKNYNLDPYRCAWQKEACQAAENLKVLTSDNVLDVEPPILDEYVKAYKDDAEMTSVDVVYCSYPASLCEVYVKLNKSVIVIATTRYDVGRYTVERLNELNENFRVLAKKPWNFFGGNNLYDARFLKYYTGINAKHLPSMCDYTKTEYKANNNNNNNNNINNYNNNNDYNYFFNYLKIYEYIFKRNIDKGKTYMMMRRRDNGFSSIFLEEFSIACELTNSSIAIEETSTHEYLEVAKYRGIVHVPYQISVMSIFEQYRMNIPMFFPSPELLARWQVDHYIMPERSFDGVFLNERTTKSKIGADESQINIPDPKNEFDYESVLYWMKFADFYQIMPYGVIYESIPHLVHILNEITDEQLMIISSNMRRYNVEFKKKLLRKWRKILLDYAENSSNHPH